MGQGASSVSCATVRGVDDEEPEDLNSQCEVEEEDRINVLPDEGLACIFQKLGIEDRNQCSLVCKRWHYVEAQCRQGLSLMAHAEIVIYLPALFARFYLITKLALRCDRKAVSINDNGLFLVGRNCLHLWKLKLKGCKQITDDGLELFSRACGSLKKFSCSSCSFGARGVNSILRHCSLLEDLTVKRLRGLAEGPKELIGPGCGKIRRLCLKELLNAQLFGPLMAGSKNLQTLMICRNSGNWDKLLDIITEQVASIVELHIERLHLSDRGLQAVSRCENLEVLYVVKTPECTNFGFAAIAEGCKKLRKLHIDGWKANRIGDEGLIGLARKCRDLQEVVLIGINVTGTSLGIMASNCLCLERLALCNSETVGDMELSYISMKCQALKRLCIKGCAISNEGMKTLAYGCPSLVKVKVRKCKGVTWDSAAWLRIHRPALVIALDSEEPSVESEVCSGSEVVVQLPRASSSSLQTRSPLAKAKLALVAGSSFVACTFLQWSSFKTHQ